MTYLQGKISSGFVALFSNKITTNIATGLFGIFLPIFLYQTFNCDIRYVAGYYLVSSFLYLVVIAFGAKFLNRFGFRNALRWSSFVGALYYLGFYFLQADNLWLITPFLLVTITLWRVLYWVPYHVDFAKFTDGHNRGKELSLIQIVLSLIGVVTPILAGFIISRFGFNALFMMGIVIHLISFVPLIGLPRTKERFSWSYLKTWKEFFSKNQAGESLAYVADGAEGMIGILVWPIFIFQVLEGNYLEVGLLSGLIVAVTIIIQLLVGFYVDREDAKRKLFRYGGLIYAVGWGLKIFVGSFFQIFIVDSFHKMSSIFFRTPFDALTYEIAADQGHYIDEFTVLHEMAITMGRVLICGLVIFLAPLVSLEWLFVLAILATLLVSLVQLQKGKYMNRER